MGAVLKGGTLVELEPACVERGDLRIEGGRIVERGVDLEVHPGEEVIQLEGKLLLPGLVSAHAVPALSLARGLLPPTPQGDDPLPPRLALRRRVEAALDETAIQLAGAVAALEALYSGTTTLVANHASPAAVHGSLLRLARGFHEVGTRGILSYAVSDLSGAVSREQALEEVVSFANKAQGRFRGAIGIGPLGGISDEGLDGVQQALEASPGAMLHVELAESAQDGRESLARHGAFPVERLLARGLLGPRSLAAHLVHLDWPELSKVITTGTWMVHAARANMQSEVGYAPAGKFGSRTALGTAGAGADLFAEAQSAHARSCDAGQPVDVLRALANGHRLASDAFGIPLGPLREGAAADVIVLDYRPPTPLTAMTLGAHLLDGLGSRHVEAVMVDGVWRLWARRPLGLDPDALAEEARRVSSALAAKLAA